MRVGITGHQAVPDAAREYVLGGLRTLLQFLAEQHGRIVGFSSLAVGADQIFAREVLRVGGDLVAVIPSSDYHKTFSSEALVDYEELLDAASRCITLDFPAPSEDAFLAAGMDVVDRCDLLVAVWDGQPSASRGGTGDAVEYARQRGKNVQVIWPQGVQR